MVSETNSPGRLGKSRTHEIAIEILFHRLKKKGIPSARKAGRSIPKIAKRLNVPPTQIRKAIEEMRRRLTDTNWHNGQFIMQNPALGPIAYSYLIGEFADDDFPRRDALRRELPNKAKEYGIDLREAQEFMSDILPKIIAARLGCTKVSLEWNGTKFLEE